MSGAPHQWYQNTWTLGLPKKRMLQQFCCRGSLRWISNKHSFQKTLKARTHLCKDNNKNKRERKFFVHVKSKSEENLASLIYVQLTLCEFFNFGGGISLMRRMACKGGSLKKGGSPSTISIIIIPNDQMSTSGPYGNLKQDTHACCRYCYNITNKKINLLQ